MKKLIKRILFGKPAQGETLNLEIGTPRIQSTCQPAEKLDFNAVFQNVHRELKAISDERYGTAG